MQQSSNHSYFAVVYMSRPLYSHGGLQEWSILLPCEAIMHCLQSELTEVPRLFLFSQMTSIKFEKKQQLTAKATSTFEYHYSIHIAFLPRLEGLCHGELVYRVLLKPEMKWKKRF